MLATREPNGGRTRSTGVNSVCGADCRGRKGNIKLLSDEDITTAIQNLGLRRIERLQQELMEGLRNGRHEGYVVLRILIEEILESPPPSFDGNGSA